MAKRVSIKGYWQGPVNEWRKQGGANLVQGGHENACSLLPGSKPITSLASQSLFSASRNRPNCMGAHA